MFWNERSAKLIATALVGAAGLLTVTPAPVVIADDGSVTPMPGVFRRCDHGADTFVDASGDGRAVALISRGPQRTVSAEVQLATASPNTQYNVRLIQMPRPSLNCLATDPGVTVGSLNTDGIGAGSVVLNSPKLAGTTGAWVFIDRPGEYSQTPVEFYTSDFVANV